MTHAEDDLFSQARRREDAKHDQPGGGFIHGGEKPQQPYSEGTTSEAAAESMEGLAGLLRKRVYYWLQAKGCHGGTDEEGQIALQMHANTYAPRRYELMKSGHVKKSGQRRQTTSGRSANVWVAAEFALFRTQDSFYSAYVERKGRPS